MTGKADTREKILSAGAQIIHRKGYFHTGIQEILKAAGVPKGSFYFYFKNKEDFGLQVIEWYGRHFRQMLTEVLNPMAHRSPLERMSAIFDWFVKYYEEIDFTCGCPVGNLAQEMGDLNPDFSLKLRQAVDQMVALYAGFITEAQAQGEIGATVDAREAARFIVSSWHGALIHMKISQGSAPLENHKKYVFEHVLGVRR